MEISIIFAHTVDWIIGKNNNLPWGRIKADMKWFKKHTLHKTVLMGRKTFESLGGRNLVDRKMIVISKSLTNDQIKDKPDNLFFCQSIEEGIELAKTFKKELMVIGGSEIYKQFLDKNISRIYETTILSSDDTVIEGDVYFPKMDFKNFYRCFYTIEEEDNFILSFAIYNKRFERN